MGHVYLVRGLLCVALAAPSPLHPIWAQQVDSRAAEIEAARAKKARELEPEDLSRTEDILLRIREQKIVERITSGVGGFRVKVGGLVTGSGIALGPEYINRDLFHGNVMFRTSARASMRAAYLMDAQLGAPKLVHGKAFVDLYAIHRDYPRMQYYGQGPHSAKTGRSNFRLEDTAFDASAGVRPFRHLSIGATGGYLLVNVGPGTDSRFVSSEKTYFPADTPGIQKQSNFLRGGPFVQFDYRDNPGGPRSGGNYILRYLTYSDRQRDLHSFRRLEFEAQQYIPFFNRRRVIALRGKTVLSDPNPGHTVPFYLQPVVGGSEDLRGFRALRFYDDNSMVLNGEYRWEVFSGLDMALFVDSGKVFHRREEWNFKDLERAYGFGFRFNVRNDVFLRIDTGFSREGFQLWFKFNNVF